MEKVVEKFVRYARVFTTSDPKSETYPSSARQWDLLNMLAEELKTFGVSDVSVDKFGYVTGTIPSNLEGDIPAVGFISHVDTSPDFSGQNVVPRIIENYDGRPIILNEKVTIDPKEFPEILAYKGQSIITASGDTLLGADDKAGVAEIMAAVEILMSDSQIKHGPIKIGFTPDEEIGKGTDFFDVKKFGADFAYTLDGGEIGELEFENFNAAAAKIVVAGRSVHPGEAKNKMINASLVAHKIVAMLPAEQRPEYTEAREGFIHLLSIIGSVESAEMEFIIRDHSREKFLRKKELLQKIVAVVNAESGKEIARLEMNDQYYNMLEKIEPVMWVADIAREAMLKAGVQPKVRAIRGGTDGARLSYAGLPCPNIFAGGHNFHGPFEFIPIPSMQKAVEVILNICALVPSMAKK